MDRDDLTAARKKFETQRDDVHEVRNRKRTLDRLEEDLADRPARQAAIEKEIANTKDALRYCTLLV